MSVFTVIFVMQACIYMSFQASESIVKLKYSRLKLSILSDQINQVFDSYGCIFHRPEITRECCME